MTTIRPARPDLTHEARLGSVGRQIFDHEAARGRRVLVADADCAEQHRVLRGARDESANAAPQQQQRGEAALIFGPHERAAELDRRVHGVEHAGRVLEQGVRIQATFAVARKDLVYEAESVGPGNCAGTGVPGEQVQVVVVEQVDVRALARSLADGPKRQFAQSADFLKRPGNLLGTGVIDVESVALDQALARG